MHHCGLIKRLRETLDNWPGKVLKWLGQGCRNPGRMGGYIPPIIWLHPPIILLWSTSASHPIIGLLSASGRWNDVWTFFGLHVISETRTLQFPVKTSSIFFVVLTQNRGEKQFNFQSRPFFWSLLKFGDKNSSVVDKDLFFGLHLICLLENNRGRDSSPPMLKIGQNWNKIANYLPQCSP